MDAMELITCFYDGLDDIVRDVAEELAVERGSVLEDDPSIVAIEVEDVRQAGDLLLDAIKRMLTERRLPIEIERPLSEMGECFEGQL